MKRVCEVYAAEYMQYDFTHILPPEIWHAIFSIALTSLQEIAQVSTKWRDMAYDPDFYKAIFPNLAFGEKAWREYIGIPDKETYLPYCAFKYIEGEGGYLTWVPETVTITKEDVEIEKIVLDRGSNLESMFLYQKQGTTVSFHPSVWQAALREDRGRVSPHWVWMKRKPVKEEVKIEEVTVSIHIASFMDTLVTVIMEKIRSGKSCFDVQGEQGIEKAWVGLSETTNGYRIYLNDPDPGIHISSMVGARLDTIVTFFAHKSPGRRQNMELPK